MAERDYSKEYQKRMETSSQIVIKVSQKLIDDFSEKVKQNGTNKSAVLLEMIMDYTY